MVTTLLAGAVLAGAVLAGCGGPAPAPSGGPVPARARTASGGNWDTYHNDNVRSGVDAAGTNLDGLHSAWTSSGLDGHIYAEPLVYQALVVVATENDTLYGLRASDGAVVWTTHLGTPVPGSALPCGDVSPLGITGTPVIDAASGRLYAVAEESVNGKAVHELAALDAATGKVLFTESADPAGMNTIAQQQRSALSLANGNVYVEYGGLYGDCGSYHGWVVGAPAGGPGSLLVYQVPTHHEGAIWAPPGASVDAAGRIYLATGNGDSTTGYDYGNSVIKLSPALGVLDSFAPANWAQDNSSDADLGSTSPVLLPGNLVFQVGKEKTGYLLNADHLGGIGGQLFSANVCFTIGGAAVQNMDVYVSCRGGVEDVHVTANPPSFKVNWTGPRGATGPPVAAGGLVWSAGGSTLYGLDPVSGHVVQQVSLGAGLDHFVTPAVGDGLLVIGTSTTVRAFHGSAGALHLVQPVVGRAADGGLLTYDAPFDGSWGGRALDAPIVAISALS